MAQNLDFQKEVLEADKPVVAEFWAPWCGYCRRLAPAVDQLEREIGGAVRILRINVDDEPDVTQKYEVDTIPALVLFRNGKASDPLVNPPSQAAMKSWLRDQGAL